MCSKVSACVWRSPFVSGLGWSGGTLCQEGWHWALNIHDVNILETENLAMQGKCKTSSFKAWNHEMQCFEYILKSKEPTTTFVPKILVSWFTEWVNCKGFLEPKSIHWKKKQKNLKLEKWSYITDIKITFWETAQYIHSKQLEYSFEKIFSLIFGQIGCKRQKSYFQTNIVTCLFIPTSPNLLVQLSYF